MSAPIRSTVVSLDLRGFTAFAETAGPGEAKAGQIRISQRLLATVEDLVEVEPVGELALRGFHRPITAHSVLRLAP